ncbi:Uncharacterised protein [Zhongshania aliphaticivorans]|uniref:SPOR domain-containing protein n=1 Tax=Zhongshania aliphaticivorans TaxID=1470434 RepID=A0A5S9QLH0_9GAMM|nr:hypothetical protein [Zhongshania aliphaticivorans]CAA0112241.1 Uncharacterised protein [Zhongshania aliphaticivorans]CAA0119159.1 Uncharacterised protein [Zhongshania aliphaticivorans]
MRWLFLFFLIANVAVFVIRGQDDGSQEFAFTGEEQLGGLVLLSESKAVSESDMSPVVESEGGKLVEAPLGCLVLGPYRNISEARGDRESILGSRLLLESYERSADYWVYLGPYGSASEAAKIGASLRIKRIDNFVIRSGELKNAISLGVFTSVERANIHAKGLRKKKYEVSVRRVGKLAKRYWLAYQGGENAPLYLEAKSKMQKNTDNNKSLEKKSCNLIASYKELD